jgi:hypothetical protein
MNCKRRLSRTSQNGVSPHVPATSPSPQLPNFSIGACGDDDENIQFLDFGSGQRTYSFSIAAQWCRLPYSALPFGFPALEASSNLYEFTVSAFTSAVRVDSMLYCEGTRLL